MTTGPIRVPKQEMEDWYVRFKNVCKTLHQRHYGLGCNPRDRVFIRDMLERLAEDEDWQHKDVPILVVHKGVAPGTFQPVENAEATAKAITLQQAMKSNRGYGRWKGISLPSHGEVSKPFKLSD